MDLYAFGAKTSQHDLYRKKMISRPKSEGESDDGVEELHRTRAGRTLRNRRYRRILEEQKQSKRLFTPEIKRFLKGWLVRRRKNPYPNRSEKKDLALKTGLTYVQICNWFANWRRKLKKTSKEKYRSTWGSLIKDYNTKAQGNVEQFSISSDDSIWDEAAYTSNEDLNKEKLSFNTNTPDCDHSYFSLNDNNNVQSRKSNIYLGLTETGNTNEQLTKKLSNIPHLKTWGRFEMKSSSQGLNNNKKVTKRLPDYESRIENVEKKHVVEPPPLLLSKWLESAARFVPRDSFISWSTQTWHNSTTRVKQRPTSLLKAKHREEELDAAEALTSLSRLQEVTSS